MNLTTTYWCYLGMSLGVTVWVGYTLHARGRIFLHDIFQRDDKLTDAVNDLLLVGFYLVNLGYVTLALRYGSKPSSLEESIEFLATKMGLVLLILAVLHFLNLYIFANLSGVIRRRRGSHQSDRLSAV